ncbi:MAG: peptidylprolyl isomerase [Anaerolineae bacterium]|nr:peptidylprolyl isomerase [Anaerolineae bacterium]
MQQLMKWKQALVLLLLLGAAGCGGNAPAATSEPAATNPPPTSETISDLPTAETTPVASVPSPTAPAETSAPPSLPTAPAAGSPIDENGVQLAARVNGVGIPLTNLEQALARRQLEVNAADAGALRSEVLDQLIEQAVIEQGAAAQNVGVTDAEVQTELQSNVELAGSQDAWNQWLATNQYTADEFTQTLRYTLITNRVRDSLTTDLNGDVRQVHARHILLKTEAEALDVLNRLNSGEDFVALAAALSNDETTRQQGGDLGWFTQEELLVPELGQAAFALQPGQIGGPVGTELGYHVIQTLEFADRPVEAERRVFIAQARFENWLKPLLENATIERYS